LLPAITVFSQTAKEQSEKITDRGVSITLLVYSGRPNPQWWLTPSDPDYKRLIELITSLKTSKEPLFKYDKWNRLGYATFWINSKRIEGLPYAIHIWRDMAYVVQSKKGEVLYALGATKIYDMLVSQAEKRDQNKFFINYHKFKHKQEPSNN
jgi:hypothetical protein